MSAKLEGRYDFGGGCRIELLLIGGIKNAEISHQKSGYFFDFETLADECPL
jgi:hypothetical protein